MDKPILPRGIRLRPTGIQIRISSGKRYIYEETIPCSNIRPRDIASAVKKRDELKARLRLGLPLTEEIPGTTNSFLNIAQDYLNTLDVKHSTMLSYENILNLYWIPEFGLWPVDQISLSSIKRVLANLAITNKSKKNILIPLRGALDHAELSPNPASGIKIKRTQTPPVDRYSITERDKILQQLSGQALVYFTLLFGTGLRPGEALALTWADYDGEELAITKQIVRRKHVPSTKTSYRRKVYVPDRVKAALNNHITRFSGKHIFLNSIGGPYLDTDIFNQAWKKAHTRARIPYRIPYTCRHTRAAEMLSMGIDPADAARQLGHSTEMFLRVYSEWMEEYAGHKDNSRFETNPAQNRSLTGRNTPKKD